MPPPIPLAAKSTRRQQTAAAAEWVDPGTLKPWPKNPRKNDGEPVNRVAESIKRFGFATPIVARTATREIIAGHTRWKAARQLKLERVPVRFLDITEREAHLLALADNRLGELAEWDTPELHAQLASYDLGEQVTAGWSDKDMAALLREINDTSSVRMGDGSGFHKMTFIVTDAQVEQVKAALQRVQLGPKATGNDSRRGNCLAALAGHYLATHAEPKREE